MLLTDFASIAEAELDEGRLDRASNAIFMEGVSVRTSSARDTLEERMCAPEEVLFDSSLFPLSFLMAVVPPVNWTEASFIIVDVALLACAVDAVICCQVVNQIGV